LKKDISPIEFDENWQHSCKDEEGNSYLEGNSLWSCCGCFKYVCSYTKAKRYTWTKGVSPLCCQTCNGTVVPGGTVVTVEKMGDKCGTVKTAVCKIKNRMANKANTHKDADAEAREEMMPAAAIEDSYHYEKCCSDGNGLHSLDQRSSDPAKCSTRKCELQ